MKSWETLNNYIIKTVKKEQQLKKQFSLYLDILTHQGPHVRLPKEMEYSTLPW